MLLDQFNNFLVIILIVAAVISVLLGEIVDASAIMAIVVLNAILGMVQESKAEQALAALKKMAATNASVLRDGHRITIPARELVPGDTGRRGPTRFADRRGWVRHELVRLRRSTRRAVCPGAARRGAGRNEPAGYPGQQLLPTRSSTAVHRRAIRTQGRRLSRGRSGRPAHHRLALPQPPDRGRGGPGLRDPARRPRSVPPISAAVSYALIRITPNPGAPSCHPERS